MNKWLNRWHKLKFKVTPPRLRSPFCKHDPWLAKYEIGDWSYGHPKVLDWGTGAKLKIGRFCSIAGNITIFVDGEHHTDWVSAFPFIGLVTRLRCAFWTLFYRTVGRPAFNRLGRGVRFEGWI